MNGSTRWLTVIDVVVDLQLGQLFLREFVCTEVESVSRPSSQHNCTDAPQWPVVENNLIRYSPGK